MLGLEGPQTSVRRLVGVQVDRVGLSVQLDGLQMDHATVGAIYATGSFMKVGDTWRHRLACIQLKRSREGGMVVGSTYKDVDGFAPMGVYLILCIRDRVIFFQAKS